jgi:hypothetical protein
MDQFVVVSWEKGEKPIFAVNAKGCPLVPSWNQWHLALKQHTLIWLDLAKSIN